MATPSLNDHMNGDLYILDVEARELQQMNVDKLLRERLFSQRATKYVTQQERRSIIETIYKKVH